MSQWIIIDASNECQFEQAQKDVAKKPLRTRADVLLVEKGLAGQPGTGPSAHHGGRRLFTPPDAWPRPVQPWPRIHPLEVKGRLPFVSRGGVKLAHALDVFGLDVQGLEALDVGASTGGFTDCLLQRGANHVYAVDVGRGQMDYGLRQDPRVTVMEGVNARYPFQLSGAGDIGIAVMDVSFISATKVIPEAVKHLGPGRPLVVLLKPQFEALKNEVGRKGVIRDPHVHARVLARFIVWAVDEGLRLRDLTASPILGDAGNAEFFLHLETPAEAHAQLSSLLRQ